MTKRTLESFETCFIEEQARGRIIALRDIGQITQQEIAKKAGLSVGFMSDWINRKRSAGARSVSKILRALGAVITIEFPSKKRGLR